MSTDNNIEQVKAIFDAFGQGNVPFILDQLAPEVRFTSHLDPIVPWAGEFSGKDGAAEFFGSLGGSLEVTGHPVNDLVAQDDTVIATGDVTFRVRATEKQGSSSWVYIFKLADGKVQSYDQFNDAGLSQAFR
jgi:hypothetical protein